jgi:RNA-directed DNA polymerase
MTSQEQIETLLAQYPTGAKARRSWEPKRSGGLRPIAKPNKELGRWLGDMNKILNVHFSQWPLFMHGGIKKRSYVSYARPHVGKQCVITIDVRRCFDSINTQQVAGSFETHLGLDARIALELAQRLCFKGKIAQGFATSNFVCNLYLLKPLVRLHTELQKDGLDFSNYVDDMALSGIVADPAKVVNQVARSLSRASLAINKDINKIRIMPSSKQQIICGLIVNKRLSITKSKKLELFSAVARGSMNSASIDGWVANLRNVDPTFSKKLYNFAVKKARVEQKGNSSSLVSLSERRSPPVGGR